MVPLASTQYLSVHSVAQEDRYDTGDASSVEIYTILVPESTVCTVQSLRERQHAHRSRTGKHKQIERLRCIICGREFSEREGTLMARSKLPALSNKRAHLYKHHRFPAEIISHCVWLCFRFSPSDRDVQETVAEREVIVSPEAVRYWGRKFGPGYANELRRRRPRSGDKWHLDEVLLPSNGTRRYLWLADEATIPRIPGLERNHGPGNGGVRNECGAASRPLYLVIVSQ
jgi:hypothetical protein